MAVARVVFVEKPQEGRLHNLQPLRSLTAMRNLASCLGQSSVQVAHSSSSSPPSGGQQQNMVQCAYLARLRGKPCRVTVTWSKVSMGQALSVSVVDDHSNKPLCKTEVKPWLFSKRKGSKVVEVHGGSGNLEITWDLSDAKFGDGPEPLKGFHVALVYDHETVLVLGDLQNIKEEEEDRPKASHDALHSSDAVMIARREHIHAKKVYAAKARFWDIGQLHHVSVECDTAGVRDPSLEIRIGKKRVLQVKKLAWKFRGNQTVYVDGLPVEVLWDVHDWLFGSSNGCAVFLFQSGQSMERFLLRTTCSQNGKEPPAHHFGFTLVLHAWKED